MKRILINIIACVLFAVFLVWISLNFGAKVVSRNEILLGAKIGIGFMSIAMLITFGIGEMKKQVRKAQNDDECKE